MSIPDDTMRRIVALKLGDKLEAVLEIIADALEPKCRKSAARAAKGTRLPDNWEPSIEDRSFAAGRLNSFAATETEVTKFRNYWCARADKGAIKLDWSRTFRNWVISAAERGQRNNGHGNGIYDVRHQLDQRRDRANRAPDLFDPCDD